MDFREGRWWPGTIRQVVSCPFVAGCPSTREGVPAVQLQNRMRQGLEAHRRGWAGWHPQTRAMRTGACGGAGRRGDTAHRRPLSSLQAAPPSTFGVPQCSPRSRPWTAPPPALSMVAVMAAELPPGWERREEPQHPGFPDHRVKSLNRHIAFESWQASRSADE